MGISYVFNPFTGELDSVSTLTDKSENPTGSIIGFGGDFDDIPSGWLLCDGSAVSRTTYGDLFVVLAEKFGVGDSSTTFNIPDLRDKIMKGAADAASGGATGGAATHTHTFTALTDFRVIKLDGAPSRSMRVGCGVVCTLFKNCETQSCRFCVAGTTGPCSSFPPFQEVVWIIKT